MSREFTKGLEAAAKQLEGTARDYQEAIDRLNQKRVRTEAEMQKLTTHREKVELLLGQAGHIRALKED